MFGCKKCMAVTGGVFLVLGVLFLLKDLDVWDFWGLNWWTLLLLYLGVATFAMRSCPECMAMKKSR